MTASIKDSLARSGPIQKISALGVEEVKELCEGYIAALKSDEPGSKWLEGTLWPLLQPLFLCVANMDEARRDIRDTQHETFKENEKLKASLQAETALVLENARKYETQLKRSDALAADLLELNTARLHVEAKAHSQESMDECHKLRSRVRMLYGLVNTLRACNESYALALDECIGD